MARGWFLAMVMVAGAVLAPAAANAARATVAVAANFLATAEDLAARFEAATGHELVLIHGATGALYAKIRAGAPYDLFLAADAERPRRLEAEGLLAPGGRRAYALGRLALAGRGVDAGSDWRALLADAGRRLAIANPETAPYGVAAREVLIALRGPERWSEGVIFGESVGQALAFVVTGNAPLGLVSLAQALEVAGRLGHVPIPPELHAPILQEAALTLRGGRNPAARAFFDFLQSGEARAIIAAAGYGLPVPTEAMREPTEDAEAGR
ncbi:molybdate ABC transporter substrate-binding protein [Meinhardsimonia xiamenensis]|nr:molybdate ABC transporter substrate-binding protein [Meinhardsimonia xiamenensis]